MSGQDQASAAGAVAGPGGQASTTAELHARSIVIDLHSGVSNDLVRRRQDGERQVMARAHLPRIRAGGLDAVCISVGGDTIFHELFKTDRPLKSCLLRLEATVAELSESPAEMSLALTAGDVRESKAAGRTAIMLGIEGARPIEDRLELLSLFYSIGVRRLQLTWNFRNAVADGCAEVEADGGLTRFGVEVVREVNRLGILLDVSHIGAASFWGTLKYAQGPVIASHANCHVLHPHPRNLTDDQIKALAETGGLIGICPLATFLTTGSQPTLAHVARHIEHVMEIAGPEHVGIGPDYMDHNAGLKMSGAGAQPDLYPPHQMLQYAAGMGTFAETGNLTAELLRRGHTERDIRLVLGENYLRIFGEVFGE